MKRKALKNYIKLLRVKHYIKNFVIFFPIIFSKIEINKTRIVNLIIGYIAFCLICSSIYVFNDLRDVNRDMNHPSKKKRPIAEGVISLKTAWFILVFCFVASMILGLVLLKHAEGYSSIFYLLLYFIINIFYSCYGKKIPIVDVVIIMLGFLIRILFGADISESYVSSWLYLTLITSAFFFAFGKRRNEIKDINLGTREVLLLYNYSFLDKFMYLSLGMANVFFALWAQDYDNPRMIWTVPIVFIISMKYSLNIEGNSDGDPVEVVFRDKLLIFLIVILILLFIYICYFSN